MAAVALSIAPPLATLAGEHAVDEAVTFCLLAFVAPVLVVLGAPWSLGGALGPRPAGTTVERLAFRRCCNRGQLRAVLAVLPFVVAIVGWRLSGSVDALVRHRWLVLAEAATLVPTGVLAWLELVRSPPFEPRSPRPRRIVLAALPMWATWICSFALGFSHADWFRAYPHRSGGLSMIADQELAAGVLWVVPFLAFVPYVFSNILRWLRGGEDLDRELSELVAGERRRGGGPAGLRGG